MFLWDSCLCDSEFLWVYAHFLCFSFDPFSCLVVLSYSDLFFSFIIIPQRAFCFLKRDREGVGLYGRGSEEELGAVEGE